MTTQQAAFNTVKAHLLAQGEKAKLPDRKIGLEQCQYRTVAGLKCAIGCLILDEEYNSEMEGQAIAMLFIGFPDLAKRLALPGLTPSEIVIFYGGLQFIHDRSDVPKWPEKLAEFAKDHRLSA